MKQPSRTKATHEQSLIFVAVTVASMLVLVACGGIEEGLDVESEQSPMMVEGGGGGTCMSGYFVDASGSATCYDLEPGSGSSDMPNNVRDHGECNNWHASSRCWGADCVYRNRWYMAETCNGRSIYEVGSCVYIGRFGNLKVYRCKTRAGTTIKVYKRS